MSPADCRTFVQMLPANSPTLKTQTIALADTFLRAEAVLPDCAENKHLVIAYSVRAGPRRIESVQLDHGMVYAVCEFK